MTVVWSIVKWILIVAVGYLFGNFSTGILLSRAQNVNIREEGSKSSGATNMLRVLGPRMGLFTFLGDWLKAAAAVFFGLWLHGTDGAMIGGLCAVIGHNWPVLFDLKGGKGVACSSAVMLCTFFWPAGIVAHLCFFACVLLTGYVSLSSMTMLFVFALFIMFSNLSAPLPIIWVLVLFGLCVWQHRSNIKRLIAGTENKITWSSFNKKKG